MGVHQRESFILEVIAASAGIFLLVGLWTPIAGAVVAVTELWIALSGIDDVRGTIMLATTGASW
jgi:putative oxidoreductase